MARNVGKAKCTHCRATLLQTLMRGTTLEFGLLTRLRDPCLQRGLGHRLRPGMAMCRRHCCLAGMSKPQLPGRAHTETRPGVDARQLNLFVAFVRRPHVFALGAKSSSPVTIASFWHAKTERPQGDLFRKHAAALCVGLGTFC